MSPKESLITVVEGIEDGLDRLQEYEKPSLDYDPKSINSLLPTSFSSSEESDSDSDSDLQKLDLLDDDATEEREGPLHNRKEADMSKKNDDDTFRGRPSSCVFVASLAASLSDDELSLSVTNHFQQWGELALVKVLRDPSNRPYAFVQYTNDADAKFALKKAQHTSLNGRTIRCEPAKVNRTLYIATCGGENVTLKFIRETLDKYGEIEQLVGNNDSTYRKSNLNKAWFVQFAYRDDAIRAYANLRLSPDWIIEWAQNIEHPSDRSDKQDEVEIDKCSIFVGQLDSKVTQELLHERFSRHGKIVEVALVLRQGNNFAFIKFANEKAAAAAVERENHAVFMEKTMHVQYRELHHNKKKFSHHTPRLNLAPPPVNLPVRRASTGSGFSAPPLSRAPMGHFGHPDFQRSGSLSSKHSASSKFHSTRSVSFSGERSAKLYQYGVESTGSRPFGTPSKTEEGTTHGSNDKQTPLSSPSNHTLNSASNSEAKTLFSTTSVSASENHNEESCNPALGGYSSGKPMRRSISHMVPPGSALPPPPPSSYYYYAYPPKENLVYDQPPSFPLAYASYPYYYPESSMVEFPQGPAQLNPPGAVPPAPYYMYYSVPQTPNFSDIKNVPSDEDRFVVPGSVKGEIDY